VSDRVSVVWVGGGGDSRGGGEVVTPSTERIREVLAKYFSDEEISAPCTDYFREVADNFAIGLTKGQKIQLLIEYCQRRDTMQNLSVAVQLARPEQSAQWRTSVDVLSTSVPGKRDQNPRMLDTAKLLMVHELANDSKVNCVSWTPQDTRLVCGLSNGEIAVWQLTSPVTMLRRVRLYDRGPVYGAVFLNGADLLTATVPSSIQRWDITTGNRRAFATFHLYDPGHMVVSPASGFLAIADHRSISIRWLAYDYSRWQHIDCPHKPICLDFAEDDAAATLAAGFEDGMIRLWGIEGRKGMLGLGSINSPLIRTLELHSGSVKSVALSPNGRFVVAGADTSIWIWQVSDGAVLGVLDLDAGNVTSLKFSRNGEWLAIGFGKGLVQLMHVENWQIAHSASGHTASVNCLAFSHSGDTLVSGSNDGKARIWAIET
jgi:WD40 repeat protein